MMKKAVIILGLVAACAAGIFFYLQHQGAPVGRYARYLPKETVSVVNLTHLNTLADSFAASALGRLLAKDTVHAIMEEMGADAQAIGDYDRLYDSVVQVVASPAFRTVFGEDSTLALLPPDQAALVANPVETLRSSLVVVAQTPAAGGLDLLAKLIKAKNISRETVDGLELTRLTLEHDQVLYGHATDRTVLLAFAPATIKTCVTTGQAGGGLEQTGLFKEALDFWQTFPQDAIYTRVVVNPAALGKLMQAAADPEIKQSAELLNGVDSMVSLSYATGQGLESRARSRYRYDQLHPLVKGAIDGVTPANPTLHLVGDKTLAYNWASSLRPEMLLKAFSAQDQEYRQADAAVRQNLGVSLDELGRAFGPQYGMVFDDVVRAAFFPVPRMTLFVGVRDRRIAETVLGNLRMRIADTGMAVEAKEEVAGRTLYSWPILPDETVQPAMVLTDTMLYVSVGKQPLKDILGFKGAAGALAAPVAQQLGHELSERVSKANFGTFVLYPERMSKQTGEMIDWLANILAATKNFSIARLNREMVQLMQSTEILAATSNLGKEQADWTMTLRRTQPKPAGKSEK